MTTVNLNTLADELLAHAAQARAGRASETVRGHGDRLRETVIALRAGQALHDWLQQLGAGGGTPLPTALERACGRQRQRQRRHRGGF